MLCFLKYMPPFYIDKSKNDSLTKGDERPFYELLIFILYECDGNFFLLYMNNISSSFTPWFFSYILTSFAI